MWVNCNLAFFLKRSSVVLTFVGTCAFTFSNKFLVVLDVSSSTRSLPMLLSLVWPSHLLFRFFFFFFLPTRFLCVYILYSIAETGFMGRVKIRLGVWSLNGPDESSCFNGLSGLFSNWKICNLQISWPRKAWNTSNFNCPCGHKRCRLAVVVRILIWHIYIYINLLVFFFFKIISCNIYFGNFVFGLLLRSLNWVRVAIVWFGGFRLRKGCQ